MPEVADADAATDTRHTPTAPNGIGLPGWRHPALRSPCRCTCQRQPPGLAARHGHLRSACVDASRHGVRATRDAHLRLRVNPRGWYNKLFCPLGNEFDSIPHTSGAYVSGASDGTILKCPLGSSRVFPVGKADDPCSGLPTHRQHACGARTDHDELFWWPRYRYCGAF